MNLVGMMNFTRTTYSGIDDDVFGNELQEWLLDRMIKRKHKLRSLFIVRHGDLDMEESESLPLQP